MCSLNGDFVARIAEKDVIYMKRKPIKLIPLCETSFSVGSARIPFKHYVEFLRNDRRVDVLPSRNSELDNADVALVMSGEGHVEYLRSRWPGVKIILAKPHREQSFTWKDCLPSRKVTRSVNKYSRLKSRFINGQFNSLYEESFMVDAVIADTLFLSKYFSSIGKESVYLRLIEPLPEGLEAIVNAAILKRQKRRGNHRWTIGYHGSPHHFIQGFQNLSKALQSLSSDFDIKLKVITNINSIPKSLRKMNSVDIEFHEYDYRRIYHELLDVDIGYVPQFAQETFVGRALNRVFPYILWKDGLTNDFTLRIKFSANAGRSFVFTKAGIPVVQEPSYEALLSYPEEDVSLMPLNARELQAGLRSLLSDPCFYQRALSRTLEIKDSRLDFSSEAEKLISLIYRLYER